MLHFFRKYQKIFFFFTTAVIILSFCFFGTFNTMLSTEKTTDRLVSRAVDGSPIMERELRAMMRFLASGYEDRGLSSKKMPNFLNDSLIYKDFIKTGMAVILAEKAFEEIQPDLQARLKKMRHYRPYTHSQASFFGAQAVWEQFNPKLVQDLAALKELPDAADLNTFHLLCTLYQDQADFHPDLLKRMLTYQQNQFSFLPKDPRLEYENFALFGFEDLEEWLGENFLEVLSKFLINTSVIAQQKGYKVSMEEARADFMNHVQSNLQNYLGDRKLSYKEVLEYVRNETHFLGIDETEAVKIWRKALLFRKMFHDVGSAVLVDHLSHKEFQTFAKETATVDLYRLPDSLRFADFRSMLKFQTYLEAISNDKESLRQNPLAIPSVILKPEELENTFPSLVQYRFLLEIREADRERIASQISLKQTWDWELNEEHWVELTQAFPNLLKGKMDTREERFLILDQLDPQSRLKVDQYARDKITYDHPEWISEALDCAPVSTQTIGLRLEGGTLPFEGVQDPGSFLQVLLKAPIKDQIDYSASEIAAQSQLSEYTWNQKNYYKIAVVKRGTKKELISFEEANKDGTLDDLLDKRLKQAYPEIRKKDTVHFQMAGGDWKSFEEVKDLIGAKVFSPVLKAIEKEIPQKEQSRVSPDQYASFRLASHVREIKQKIEISKDDSMFVKKAEDRGEEVSFNEEPSYLEQWLLSKIRKEVDRGDADLSLKKSIFEDALSGWSNLEVLSDGDIRFFQVIGRNQSDDLDDQQLEEAHQALSIDAQRALMRQLLEEKRVIGIKV